MACRCASSRACVIEPSAHVAHVMDKGCHALTEEACNLPRKAQADENAKERRARLSSAGSPLFERLLPGFDEFGSRSGELSSRIDSASEFDSFLEIAFSSLQSGQARISEIAKPRVARLSREQLQNTPFPLWITSPLVAGVGTRDHILP